jgi:ribosome-binding factor A
MGSPYRVNRVRESLLREFSDIVRQLKDPRVRLVTVVDAEISPDLRYAKMFVSAIGSAEEQEEAAAALCQAQGYIRREIAHRLPLRQAPEITVVYDHTSERAAKVSALINSLKIPKDADG